MVKDLTQGNPRTVLWKFTLPMLLSIVFQQLYNISDSIIAGQFAGEDALAAIGASYPITMIFMAVAIGSNVGCSVVISQFFGAGKYNKMKTAISTTIIASLVLSIILTVSGIIGTSSLMKMINTPENIFADGALYLKIYTAAFVFVFLYNTTTGIFTAMGDSKTPLYFLIGSSICNILLALLFVGLFRWGVAGAAWATFISQGVACLFSVIAFKKRLATIKTEKYPLFSGKMLGKIASIAIPSILQQSFVSVGNIFIQAIINSFGSSVIAGYSAAVKLNTFATTAFSTLGNATSSFTAQNMGAKKLDRIKDGLKASLTMAFYIGIPCSIALFVFSDFFIGIFVSSESELVLSTGRDFLRIVAPFYFIVATKISMDGVLRGAGAMPQFMITTFTDLIIRVVLAEILSGYFGAIGIWLSWPLGWIVSTLLSILFYKSGKWKNCFSIY